MIDPIYLYTASKAKQQTDLWEKLWMNIDAIDESYSILHSASFLASLTNGYADDDYMNEESKQQSIKVVELARRLKKERQKFLILINKNKNE